MSDQDLVLNAVRKVFPLGGRYRAHWSVVLGGAPDDGVAVEMRELVSSGYSGKGGGRTHDFTVPATALDGDVCAFVAAELEPLR